jgi:phenylpropionate dioxygenase-like ring-hydroxylating dioxygenase large terminal subunit
VPDPAPTPTLPAAAYLDPAGYAAEVQAAFRGAWVPVCRVDALEQTGDRYATSIAGHPVVALRDNDEIRVLTNVCQHRWSTIVEPGPSHSRTLVCPYHRWSYALDGRLTAAPLAGAFSLDDVCLPAVRHEVWEGFVMVNLDGEAPPLAPQVAGLAQRLAPWRLGELVTVASRSYPSTWNWKVMVENWIECYHHLGAHRTTVEPWQPSRTTRIDDPGEGPWTFMTVDTDPDIVGALEEQSPGLTRDQAELLTIWAVFPFLLGGTQARFSFWLELTPSTVDRHQVTWHVLVHPDLLPRWPPAETERVMDILGEVHVEDMATCTRVDAGLRSGMLETGRLVALETPIAHFHEWLRGRLG